MTPSKLIKRAWQNASPGVSLKQWARERALKGDVETKQWFTNKGPAQKNAAKATRLKNKGARITAEKQATRAAKQKKSQGGKR